KRVPGLEQPGLDTAEQVLRPQRVAAMREGDDDPQTPADEALQLVLRFGETARGQRRALRLERVRLALRKRIEPRDRSELELLAQLLLPRLGDRSRPPDELGR